MKIAVLQSGVGKIVGKVLLGIFLPMIIFVGIGRYIDSIYGTTPAFTIGGLAVAFLITSVLNVFRMKEAIVPILEATPREDKKSI